MAHETKKAVCYFCKGYCPVLVHTENGRLVLAEAPCRAACPAGVDVPRYVRLIGEGKFAEAVAVIREKIPLPAVCGYVCPHPCETKCGRGDLEEPIAISNLKRFAVEHDTGLWKQGSSIAPSTGKRVAIIGSGPTGLTAGYYLAKLGHSVTVFEALPEPGGMMRLGIPDYHLPKDILQRDIDEIVKQGVEIRVNTPVGPDLTLDDLRQQGYDAIFISTGAHQSRPLDVEGANLNNVFQGVNFLHDNATGKLAPNFFTGKKVVTIGGGNVAIDCARTALRMGASEVQLVCLECREEMPAYEWESQQAVDEGVILNHSWGPKRILGNDNKDVTGIEFVRCTSVFDSEGKFNPAYDESMETSFPADAVIIAIGQVSDLSFLGKESRVQASLEGTIKVDDATLATDADGIFAGGDIVRAPASVIEAIADGRKAAIAIDRYLGGEGVIDEKLAPVEEVVPPPWATELEEERHQPLKWQRPRQQTSELPVSERLHSFAKVDLGFSEEAAIEEARRCLSCDLDCVEVDPNDPARDSLFPRARGCDRKRRAMEFMYHPDRLCFPLKRAGERGEGKWQRISWEQAFDEIAEKLQVLKDKYGAETLGAVKGTFRNKNFLPRFLMQFGSPNSTTVGKICYGPLYGVGNAMFGCAGDRFNLPGGHRGVGASTPKCIFISGTDPFQSWPRVATRIMDSKNAGGKLIVVDPRETESTKIADLWLQLRPGTDTALFLSIINVIIEEGLYDKDFVEKWCYGFDKLAERAREYPPEKAAEITWVPDDKIREAARIIGENKPIYTWNGMGTEQLHNGIQAIHARLILAAITGSIDAEGGTYIAPNLRKMRGMIDVSSLDALSPEQRAKQLGADRFKFLSFPGYDMMAEITQRVWGIMPAGEQSAVASPHQPSLYRAMFTGEPYPVKALITMCHNPMLVQANTKLVYKALKSLELLVVLEYWLTPTAELADYVLPVASWLERPDHNEDYGGEQALPSTIPGEYDRKSDYEILREIGVRLGQDWPWKNLEEVFDYFCEPSGMTFKQFVEQGRRERPPVEYKKYEKIGFATNTGKAELYSTILEKLGYDPLPYYEEPPETPISRPDLVKEYPLILTTGGRFRPMFHSEWRQIDSIRKRRPHPTVQLHPETAKELGIDDGDWIWIESPRGRIRMKCKYHNIDRRVVHCEHGWWFPELPGEEPWLHGAWESNVNVLTDDDPDHCNPISGGWPLRTALCRVYKAKQY